MGGKASKNKGKAFESFICKHLNKTYETEEFKRTPSSGALMGRSNWIQNEGLENHTKNVLSADIIAPSWFKCSVECKWYADKPSYHLLLKKNDAQLDSWLAETLFDAINTKRLPLLFFKTNNKGVYMALPNMLIDSTTEITNYAIYNCFAITGIENFDLFKNKLQTLTNKDCQEILNKLQTNKKYKEYTTYLINQIK